MKYKIGNVEVKALAQHDFVVISRNDFDKVATKVKEPKFKVGDAAFIVEDCGDEELSIVRYMITDFSDHHQVGFVYEIDYTEKMSESDLLTLKEAIEKLREL